MSKTAAVLGTSLFFLIAPCMAAGVVPWWVTRWEFRAVFPMLVVMRTAGVILPASRVSVVRFPGL